jgi:hypothetical protein
VVGAAVATALTYSIYTAANVYFIHQELSPALWALASDTGTVLVVAGGMGLLVLALLPYVSGVGSLLAVVAAGGATWAALAVLTGLLDVERVVGFLA